MLAAGCKSPPPGAEPDTAAPRADTGTADVTTLPDSAPPDVGTAAIGASCSGGCLSGLTCDDTMPGGGTCTKKCNADKDCGERARCVADAYAGGAKRCVARCNVRQILEPCRAGYVCRLDGQNGYCAPSCRDKPCPDKLACDKVSGLCLDTTSGKVGDACGKDVGRCDATPNGVCLSLGTFLQAFCTTPCAPFTRPCDAALGEGAACIIGGGADQGAFCAFICDPDNPSCPSPNMQCQPFGRNYSICVPKKS